MDLNSILVGSEMVSLVCWYGVNKYRSVLLLSTSGLRHRSTHGSVRNSFVAGSGYGRIDFRVYLGLAHGTVRSGPSRPGCGGEWLVRD